MLLITDILEKFCIIYIYVAAKFSQIHGIIAKGIQSLDSIINVNILRSWNV